MGPTRLILGATTIFLLVAPAGTAHPPPDEGRQELAVVFGLAAQDIAVVLQDADPDDSSQDLLHEALASWNETEAALPPVGDPVCIRQGWWSPGESPAYIAPDGSVIYVAVPSGLGEGSRPIDSFQAFYVEFYPGMDGECQMDDHE